MHCTLSKNKKKDYADRLMRLIDLFRITILLGSSLIIQSRVDGPDAFPPIVARSRIETAKDSTPESLLGDEARLVHSVFRILREQVSIINSLIDKVGQRRSLRTKKDHPEVLDAISLSISDAKSSMSNVLRKVKACKKIVKSGVPHLSSNSSAVIVAVNESNALLITAISETFESMNTFRSRLEQHKTGLYSRKQKLGEVIGDVPGRLHTSLLKFDNVSKELSQISKSLLELEGRGPT